MVKRGPAQVAAGGHAKRPAGVRAEIHRRHRTHPAPARRGSADELGRAFVDESRRRLRDEYLPKIERALRELGPEDLWWRPNSSSNSIGNLLLHLEGNVRQWILHGVGRQRGARDRDAEFAAHGGRSRRALLQRLQRTLAAADVVLARLGPDELRGARHIQVYDVTVLQAVYHVVEHFSGHTGQILWIVKMRRGRDLGFYADLEAGRRAKHL